MSICIYTHTNKPLNALNGQQRIRHIIKSNLTSKTVKLNLAHQTFIIDSVTKVIRNTKRTRVIHPCDQTYKQ